MLVIAHLKRLFMFSPDILEEKLNINERKMRELAIRLEKLDEDTHAFLEELEISPEQLTTFISQKENFTDSNWQELQQQKKQMDDKLETELNNIRNPLQSKQIFSSLNVARHWLYVR
ncbi:Uncharacterized protein NEOC95_000551 [Neochlamydia sp. AcF95]|nr:Uncharacterized protein [Neochlamydia sp. AcF95]